MDKPEQLLRKLCVVVTKNGALCNSKAFNGILCRHHYKVSVNPGVIHLNDDLDICSIMNLCCIYAINGIDINITMQCVCHNCYHSTVHPIAYFKNLLENNNQKYCITLNQIESKVCKWCYHISKPSFKLSKFGRKAPRLDSVEFKIDVENDFCAEYIILNNFDNGMENTISFVSLNGDEKKVNGQLTEEDDSPRTRRYFVNFDVSIRNGPFYLLAVEMRQPKTKTYKYIGHINKKFISKKHACKYYNIATGNNDTYEMNENSHYTSQTNSKSGLRCVVVEAPSNDYNDRSGEFCIKDVCPK